LNVPSLGDDDDPVSRIALDHLANENLRLAVCVVGTGVDQVPAKVEVVPQRGLMLGIAVGDPVTPKSQRMTLHAGGTEGTKDFGWRIHQKPMITVRER